VLHRYERSGGSVAALVVLDGTSMTRRLVAEEVDLGELARVLRAACGASVVGVVVGRTLLRDEVARHVGCSQLEAETLVDTMVGRGFLVRTDDGQGGWLIAGP